MVEDIYKIFLKSSGVGTDTRKDLKDKVFFALKGDNFDGNKYANLALKKGALCAIIDDDLYALDKGTILVKDVLSSLQLLANYHRNKLGTTILGITGSNGKTTNKELISRCLSKKYNTFSTKGNFNNHLGVPLSLLEIKDDCEFAIIEMGANQLGDIKQLCKIAEPNHGFITNIGIAHLEGFQTKDHIKKEKGELFKFVQNIGGLFFVNDQEEEIVELSKGYVNNVFIGKSERSIIKALSLNVIPNISIEFLWKNIKFIISSSLYGSHNFENIKMAVGIALYFGVSVEDIQNAIKTYKPKNNRSQIIRDGSNLIMMDAYNANPSSMKKSIISFSNFKQPEKILILGDMLELGSESMNLHNEILDLIEMYEWEKVYLIGAQFGNAGSSRIPKSNYYYFENRLQADDHINSSDWKNKIIMVKGSRGQALEKLSVFKKLI